MLKIRRVLTKKKATITLELTDKIPYKYGVLAFVGNEAIQMIVKRTESGLSWRGQPFKRYDESYVESDAFEAWGKTKKVNMNLSGDMLGLLSIIKVDINTVTIGWTDPVEILKVYNHNTGDTVAKREFFNLSEKELNQLYDSAKPDIEEALEEEAETDRWAKLFATALYAKDKEVDPIKTAIDRMLGGVFDEE